MKKTLLLLLLALSSLAAQDISGTYTGTLKAQTPDGPQEGPGTIVLKMDGEKLNVTAGPLPDQQLPGTKVERSGDSIKFEIAPPGDGPRVMRFAVTVKDGKLTGEVTMTRGDETRTGKLDLVKQ